VQNFTKLSAASCSKVIMLTERRCRKQYCIAFEAAKK